jgi:hypothetical protein
MRRIALISMPCDSAAAGLFTLGAMIRDLGNPRANSVDEHYDALLGYAQLFLEHHPAGVTGRLRSALNPHEIYQITNETDFGKRQLAFTRRGVIYRPNPQFAIDWYIDGEPPPQWNNDEGHLPREPYRQIIAEAEILPDNLGKSYSGLCLAGRATGEASSREICSSIRFRSQTGDRGLEELLTVYSWSACNISRVSFFNTFTERLDRNSAPPSLVVVDGDVPFLKAIGRVQFQQSDIVGVIHRAIERDKLEAVGSRIFPNQWYTEDPEMLRELPPVPRGISILILRRRS